MGKVKIISYEQAAEMVNDKHTVVISGFVQSALPEGLLTALENRFVSTAKPRDLTVYYVAGIGNRNGAAVDHFAHEGMVKRVVGGHWNLIPKMGKMAIENKIEAYNLPQGTLSQMMREIASGRPGLITHVGLGTFVDPRIEGGKLNSISKEDLVEVIEIKGQEKLFYNCDVKFNVALMRGTYADENGNITMEHEVGSHDVTSMAQATKNAGGKVIVQVKAVVQNGSLDPKLVKIPGIYVDAVVINNDNNLHQQTLGTYWEPAASGQYRIPLASIKPAPLDERKIVGRRGAMELKKDTIVNLGIGMAEAIAAVANEEGIGDIMTLTVEPGPIGGVPLAAAGFGSALNPEAIIDQALQFDFYDGGGLDMAFLGLAETDVHGNINVSKFGPRVAGTGGFVNITQNAKEVFFCGTFTAGGLKVRIENGKLIIDQEGRERKFVKHVQQITFSGAYAVKKGQPVKYITERAVFELRSDGMYLTEIAPGIDLKTQILDLMDFEPKIDGQPKLMDSRIFEDVLMGLKNA